MMNRDIAHVIQTVNNLMAAGASAMSETLKTNTVTKALDLCCEPSCWFNMKTEMKNVSFQGTT